MRGFIARTGRAVLGVALALSLAGPAPVSAAPESPTPESGKPAAGAAATSACLYEGKAEAAGLCIRKESFNADLCGAIATLADRNAVPPDFFARLIWRESLFRPEAVSPKGAEGIAQFMPSTARLRRLDNSFDVVAALATSAAYLQELNQRFGNFGLAAAAYNAGEAGLQRFLSTGRLPLETRDYVFAITGHPAESWKTDPPERAAPPLQDNKPFHEACLALATSRVMQEPVLTGTADWAPWGAQLAGHASPAVALRLFTRVVLSLPPPLNAERALITRQRGGSFGKRPRYAARIGRETRKQADDLCTLVRRAGQACIVLRNGPAR